MQLCGKNCVSICGFCSRYNIDNKECELQNKHKEKYQDCDCDKFKCFTLDYFYNEEKYLTINYIKDLFEKG